MGVSVDTGVDKTPGLTHAEHGWCVFSPYVYVCMYVYADGFVSCLNNAFQQASVLHYKEARDVLACSSCTR